MLENQLATTTLSLGRHASHTLPQKIVAAAEAGFKGIEIVYDDVQTYAMALSIPILEASTRIRDLCQQHNLHILSVASLENFEGTLSPLDERLERAARYLAVARTLGADYLQVPSTFDRRINNDRALIVSELRQLSDLASSSEPVIKIAYENLAWSLHCALWQDALDIVRQVDKDNFGLCLDSFHITAALWGDPCDPSGRQVDGDKYLEESLHDFVENCPLDKIYYVQLSDGERFDPPYSKDHPWYDAESAPSQVWSNEGRPFPLETEFGAFVPVQSVAHTFLVDKKFTGWVSLETFDRRMRKRDNDPVKNASRAIQSWKKLHAALSASTNAAE